MLLVLLGLFFPFLELDQGVHKWGTGDRPTELVHAVVALEDLG